jgi:hypothetical protein
LDEPVRLPRPFGVWVVTIYIGISVVFNLVAVVSTNLGMIPLDKSAQAYIRLSVLDQGMIAILLFLSIAKGIALFRLKKYAFGLFLLAFIVNGAFLIFRGQAMRTALPLGGETALFTSPVIGFVILLYVWMLYLKEILKPPSRGQCIMRERP